MKEKGKNNVYIEDTKDLQIMISGEEVLSLSEEEGDTFEVRVANSDSFIKTRTVSGQSNADLVALKLLEEGNLPVYNKLEEMFYLGKARKILDSIFHIKEHEIIEMMNRVEIVVNLIDLFKEWEFCSVYGSGENLIIRIRRLLIEYEYIN